ncbi:MULTISPECIES: GNAT family N-acetyltransferase [Bacillus]|uniref:Acetyltransferase, gnat family n=2 Tax=Bacillus anthracis TaxID=1392 RepID=Q9X308_BACAN|nr:MULTISPECIES: GNAT family N-acetyltransferase [Bacillus]AAM26009.1 acetyltransferase, GNAT family, (pXO1-37) [Bacillus anthracis str. A2012]EJT17090.1 Acetyltransferase, gnat family protein [Bacillus anthracis str. UR-1]EXJ17310.1 GNAT family acetyltransferase [Bacillus anthracis str. 95014]AAD32341.1 pXO1-37 [Bacillus anthracis]AAT28795.2 acetyltransferase, gnat family [Bacillus anthracis str. 'Ames Ancestor']
MLIRDYQNDDEQGWLRCRVLAFLNTAYYDNVLNKKEVYKNPSIELVAEIDGKIVGLIDVEYEKKEKTVCSRGTGLGGMIWHIAVHPDYARQGIGESLLKAAEKRAIDLNLNRFEAWTHDDGWVRSWYEKMGFRLTESYYHLYFEGNEMNNRISSNIPNLYPVFTFGHYDGEETEQFKELTRRHQCVCYEKYFE